MSETGHNLPPGERDAGLSEELKQYVREGFTDRPLELDPETGLPVVPARPTSLDERDQFEELDEAAPHDPI